MYFDLPKIFEVDQNQNFSFREGFKKQSKWAVAVQTKKKELRKLKKEVRCKNFKPWPMAKSTVNTKGF